MTHLPHGHHYEFCPRHAGRWLTHWTIGGPNDSPFSSRAFGYPGERQVVEFLMLDLQLFPVEVQEHWCVGEPLVGITVPEEPGMGEPPANQPGEAAPRA